MRLYSDVVIPSTNNAFSRSPKIIYKDLSDTHILLSLIAMKS